MKKDKELTRSKGAYMRTKKVETIKPVKKNLIERLTTLGVILVVGAVAFITALVVNLLIK